MKAIYLKITTWVGTVALGAQHYNAELLGGRTGKWGEHESKDLMHKLTRAEVTATRKARREIGLSLDMISYIKAGMESNAYLSEAAAIKQAKKVWQEYYPEGEVLFLGDPVYIEPMPVLDGPEELASEMNALRGEFEALDRRRHADVPTLSAIEKRRVALLKKWGLEE